MPNVITLDINTASVQYLCMKDKRLVKIVSMVGPISYSLHEEEPFAFLIHEIIEQMLSVKAGQKIYSRLLELCEGDMTPNRICALTDEQIRSTGTSGAKIEYIRNVASAIINGVLDFDELRRLPDKEVIASLTKTRGVGYGINKNRVSLIFMKGW